MLAAADHRFLSRTTDISSFLDLFEFLPEIVFYAKDLQSRFVAANANMLASKNLTDPFQILGKTDRDFHPPALADAYMKEDRDIMESGDPLPNQSWFIIDKNGAPGWFRSSKAPILSLYGEVIGIAGVRYPIATPDEWNRQFQDLASAVHHIEEHYADAISSEELAKLSGISVTHFNRRFSQVFRMSPRQFVIAVRVERARHLLSLSEEPVGDVALATGFYDQSHFTRHFQKVTGMTPSRYRKKFRGSGIL